MNSICIFQIYNIYLPITRLVLISMETKTEIGGCDTVYKTMRSFDIDDFPSISKVSFLH